MTDPEPKPSAKTPWVLIVGGVAALSATGVVWHLADRYWQPPEEQRWANGDISLVAGSNFQTMEGYRLTDAAGASIGDEQQGWEDPNVAVYSAPASIPPPAPVIPQQPPSPAPAQAIEASAKDAGSVAAAWRQLSTTLSGNERGIEHPDPYRADRVLVANVTKGLNAMPGDRLLWTRVIVQPINFTFAGYTVASTETKTIKVAGIENGNNSKLSLGFGLGALLPGIGKDANAPSIESSNKATADISEQYQSLGVDIRPQFLRIIRESATGGDVVGNTMIGLSMLTNPNSISTTGSNPASRATIDDRDRTAFVVDATHLTDGVQYLGDDKANITLHSQEVLPHCPLIADVWMMYEVKKLVTGGYHHLEGLQNVKLIQDGEIKQKVEIVPADDIAPAVWSIRRQKENGAGHALDLRANMPGDASRRVVSTDYTTMSELAHWLKANSPEKSLSGITFDYSQGDSLVPFKNVTNDCQN